MLEKCSGKTASNAINRVLDTKPDPTKTQTIDKFYLDNATLAPDALKITTQSVSFEVAFFAIVLLAKGHNQRRFARPSRRVGEVTLPLGESACKAGEGLHHTGSFQSAARLS